MAGLPREPLGTSDLRHSEFIAALMGLRMDAEIRIPEWDLEPSIGIAAGRIKRLGLDIRSFKEPLTTAIKTVVIPSIRKNFDEGGRPTPWEPLAEFTIKMRHYQAWPILRRTGALRKAATQFNIWTVSTTSAAIRSLPQKVWYGYVHQAGYGSFSLFTTEASKRLGPGASQKDVNNEAFKLMDAVRGEGRAAAIHIPARPFIMFQQEDFEKITAVFYEWMVSRAERVGRA